MKDIYLVKMKRWGEDDTHSYISHITTNLIEAKMLGELHSISRSRKYLPEIITKSIDENITKVYLEEINSENKPNARYKYKIHSDPEVTINYKIKHLVDSGFRINCYDLTQKHINKDIIIESLEIITFFEKDVQEYIKSKYEEYLREVINEEI
jgi:hypothetical protein